MEGGKVLPQGSIAIVLLIKLLCSKDISADVRKGFFVNLDAESTDQLSTKSFLLKTVTAPSEFSCYHKCLANDQCAYKASDPATKQCALYAKISQVEVNKMVTVGKKVTVQSTCDASPCGNRCKCNPLLGTNKYACDCNAGLEFGSPDYTYQTCSDALGASGDVSTTYRIQPTLKRGSISVKCERGNDEKGYAVFHHDTEHTVEVKNKLEADGANVYDFTYNSTMESVMLAMNHSNYCKQFTRADCMHLFFVERGATWLLGRNRQKLRFWGGGPPDGIGCACGIHGSCFDPALTCHCDNNQHVWKADEGFVSLKAVLPLAGIAIGDVRDDREILKFTIGPLKCVL